MSSRVSVSSLQFLPTPSARRATVETVKTSPATSISTHALREEGDILLFLPYAAHFHFYPRPPRGGRRMAKAISAELSVISTHALREEGDLITRQEQTVLIISTHALREEGDFPKALEIIKCKISTHALREEGDTGSSVRKQDVHDFYPRPPRGGRRRGAGAVRRTSHFYPRPPRGGRPVPHTAVAAIMQISTHALREEGDSGGRHVQG